MSFNTPVLFLIFNRPLASKQVFEKICEIKPRQLFIAADGPRIDKAGDQQLCNETRKVITDRINWDCEVNYLFRDENLGCGRAVSSAITWFFTKVSEGIILEDDCVPNLSFFSFCSELLSTHRNNTNIMHIGANNFNTKAEKHKESYYFSNYIEIWGWATWKRAWDLYDFEMKNFDSLVKSKILKNKFKTKDEVNYWTNSLASAANKQVDTWDYQWVYCIYYNAGICILPYSNLVTNIGFGEDATHTFEINSSFSNVPSISINKIIHPKKNEVNKKMDAYIFNNFYSKHKEKPLFTKVISKTKRRLRSAIKALLVK